MRSLSTYYRGYSYIQGMALYDSLAPLYDELFPPHPAAASFLDSLVPRGRGARSALDAGCATGGHALALAALGWRAVGIDSSPAMIAAARGRTIAAGLASKAEFLRASLLDLDRSFAPRSFDLVLCLGNTLPHLDEGGIASFLAQARRALAPGGALAIQALDYSLSTLAPGFSFPVLEAGGLRFSRRYEASTEGPETLAFIAELESAAGSVERNEVTLNRLGPDGLATSAREAGFGEPSLYSGWEGGARGGGELSYVAVLRLLE